MVRVARLVALAAVLAGCENASSDAGETGTDSATTGQTETGDDSTGASGTGAATGAESTSGGGSCGDGVQNVGLGEECDDGNTQDNDGCDADCFETRVSQLSAGSFVTCIVLRSGAVRCWGNGDSGVLGYGGTERIGDDETPSSAGDIDLGAPATHVTVGSLHACALMEQGTIRCWGSGQYGKLGYGNEDSIGDDPGETPAAAGDVQLGRAARFVDVGGFVTCALLDDKTVKCWGWATSGLLGYGDSENVGDNELPAEVGAVPVGGPVKQLSVGSTHACVLLETGGVRCWGVGTTGQLGYGSSEHVGDNETPADLGDVDVGGPVAEIHAGSGHTCALLENGDVKCWGDNSQGSLGLGNTTPVGDTPGALPSSVGPAQLGVEVRKLAASGPSCVVTGDGALRSWGVNRDGELGYGHTDHIGDDEFPVVAGDVPIGGAVASCAPGGGHACALMVSGRVRCWGRADHGQLGYGDTAQVGATSDWLPEDAGDVPVW